MATLTLDPPEVDNQTSTPIEDSGSIPEETSISSRLYKIKEIINRDDFAQRSDVERAEIKGRFAKYALYNTPDFDHKKYTKEQEDVMILDIERRISNDNPDKFSSAYEKEITSTKWVGSRKVIKTRPILSKQEELMMESLNDLPQNILEGMESEKLLELRDELPIEDAYPELYKRLTDIGKARSGNLSEREAFTLSLAEGVVPLFSEFIDLSDDEKASLFLGHEGYKSTRILGSTAALIGGGWGIQAFRKSLGMAGFVKNAGLTLTLEGGLGLAYKNVAPGLVAELAGKPDSYILNFAEAAAISGLVDAVSALGLLAKWGKGHFKTLGEAKEQNARIKKYLSDTADAQGQIDMDITRQLDELVDPTPAPKGTPESDIDIKQNDITDLPERTKASLISKLPLSAQPFAKRAVHFWKKYGTKEGLGTKELYEIDYAKGSKLDASLKEVENIYRDYDKAVVKKYKSHNLPSEIQDQVNAVLSKRAAPGILPEELVDPVHKMRVTIDDFSKALNDELDYVNNTELSAILVKNQGMYTYHSYKAFTDPKWAKNVPPEVMAAAKSFLRSEPSSRYGYMKGRGGRLSESEIDDVIQRYVNPRGGGEGSFFTAWKGMKGAEKNIFKKRSEIPDPLKALMGPEDDPAKIFLRTAQNQAVFLENQRMFEEMRKEGIDKVFFKNRTGIYNTEVRLGYDQSNPLGKRLKESYKGLYTTPEIAEYLKNLEGITGQNQVADAILRGYNIAVLTPKFFAQAGKTVGSPTTHLRNFAGGGLMVSANGNLIRRGGREGLKNAWDTVWGDLKGTDVQVIRDRVIEYKRQGIVGTQADVGALNDLLKDVFKGDATDLLALAERNTVGQAKRVYRKAFQTYQAEDDFWKIYNYEAEKRAYGEIFGIQENYVKRFANTEIPKIKNKDGNYDPDLGKMKEELDAEGVETWGQDKLNAFAAKLTREQIPNYREVSLGIKLLRKAPVGDFITFPAEIFRTSGNIMHQGFKEVTSKNPMVRAIGWRRLGSFGGVAVVAAPAMAGLSRVLTSTTATQDHDARRLMPPYQKNASLIYTSRSKDGIIKYIDTSFIDPYSAIKTPFKALIRNLGQTDNDAVMTDLMQGLFAAANDVISPFTGGLSLGTKSMVELVSNTEIHDSGRREKIWYESDPMGTRAAKFMTRAWNDSFELGGITTAKKLGRAALGDKRYDLPTEMAGALGVRVSTLDIKKSLGFKAGDFKRGITNANNDFRDLLKNKSGLVSPEDLIKPFYNSQASRFNYFQEAYRDIEAAVSNGLHRRDALRAFRKNNTVSRKDMYAISRGLFSPYSPSKDTYRKMRESGYSSQEIRLIRNGLNMVIKNFKKVPLNPDPDRELPDRPY